MRRRIFNLAVAVSGLLCAGVIVLVLIGAVRGGIAFHWGDARGATNWTLSVENGDFDFVRSTVVRPPATAPGVGVDSAGPDRRWSLPGVAVTGAALVIRDRHTGNILDTYGSRLGISVFGCWPLAATAVLPTVGLVGAVRGRRRAASGRCRACGYDCRATPDRCPECGEPAGRAADASEPTGPPVG